MPGCAATLAFYNGLGVFNPREGNNKILLGKVDYAMSSKNNLTAAVQPAPLGLAERRPDAAGHFGLAVGERQADIVKTDFALATVNTRAVRALAERGARVQIGRDFEQQLPNRRPARAPR